MIHLCIGAVMKLLRLIEQACGCSTVRGGGGLNVRARLCLWQLWWIVLVAMAIKEPAGVVPLQRGRREAPPTDRASLRLLHRGDQGACRCFAFASEPP